MSFSRFATFAVALFCLTCIGSAQMAPMNTAKPAHAVDNEFVQKEFGSTCSLLAGPPTFTADLDGDGVEDLVVVAKCTNPLMDQTELNYQVIDPYDAYLGFGDTKITTQFASEDPLSRGISILIIHGTGADAWRSATPKAKFILINLPFKELAVKKSTFKKKTIQAIYAQEAHEGEGTVSVTFWDGKKYRYKPMGSSME